MAGVVGGSTPSSRGQARRGAIGGTPEPCFARRPVTRVPRGPTADRPRPCSPSCPLLPPRFGWRGDARAGEEGRAHQRLPTARTPLPSLLTPGLARARPVKWLRRLHPPLTPLLPALGQGVAWGVGIQPPTPHPHGPGWRHMPEPPPHELLQGSVHRPRPCPTLGTFGPLLIRKDDPLRLTGAQPSMRQRPAAQVARQRDQPALPMRVALASMHVPLLPAQLVQQVLPLVATPASWRCQLPVPHTLVNGGPQFAPEDRHDHPPRQ